MPNVQQPEMRRTGTTSLTQDDTSAGGGRGAPSDREDDRRPVPPDQVSPYGTTRPDGDSGGDGPAGR